MVDRGQAQTVGVPAVQWQRSFGGSGSDGAFGIQQTTDGGYVVCGFSNSTTNGNKTGPAFGGNDCWVIRLDANGGKLWDRTYGGNGEERVSKIRQTSDGGFVLGGYSTTGTNGTKTSQAFGGYDYWLLRLDADGNQLWDRSYGGIGADFVETVQVLPDGGFLLAGFSYSPVSGNKTSPPYSSTQFSDAWLVRVDANGDMLWDVCHGGEQDDTTESLLPLPDGGFIVAGYSFSLPGGNKTSPNYGKDDAWMLRVSSNGQLLWERSYGGSSFDWCYGIVPAGDAFLLGAASQSSTNGNKTSPNFGDIDYWVIRVDTNGIPLWQRTFGGSGADFLRTVAPTRDGGFVLGGRSNSGKTGNKTSANFGNNDFWIVRIDAEGNKLWELAFGGTASDELFDGGQTADGGFIFAGWSYSNTNGNKTEPNFGDRDVWVVKLGPEPPLLRAPPQSWESVQTNGFRFYLNGVPDQYVIESSTDLVEWSDWQTNVVTATGEAVEITDWGATNRMQRYFRARRLP